MSSSAEPSSLTAGLLDDFSEFLGSKPKATWGRLGSKRKGLQMFLVPFGVFSPFVVIFESKTVQDLVICFH